VRRAGLRARIFYQTRHTCVTMTSAGTRRHGSRASYTTPVRIFRRYFRFSEHATLRPEPRRWLAEHGE
jgi:hypothetical protein